MMKVQESSPAYEALTQSVPTDNRTLVSLKDLGKWSGGGTPSKSKLDYWEDGTIPWVSPKDMKTDHIVDCEDHITQAAIDESTAKLIPAGSVLIVTRSSILSHTLPVAVTTIPVTINQDLKALTPREGVLPENVAWALRCFARDRRLSLIRETESQVNANLQRAERLRSSVLSKSFSNGI